MSRDSYIGLVRKEDETHLTCCPNKTSKFSAPKMFILMGQSVVTPSRPRTISDLVIAYKTYAYDLSIVGFRMGDNLLGSVNLG